MSGQYTQIISEIGFFNEKKKKKELYIKLGYIMSDPNVYEIKTIEQLESYEKIKEEVMEEYGEDVGPLPGGLRGSGAHAHSIHPFRRGLPLPAGAGGADVCRPA